MIYYIMICYIILYYSTLCSGDKADAVPGPRLVTVIILLSYYLLVPITTIDYYY